MKTEEFEKAIMAVGLKPVEVRLHRGQVTLFICEDEKRTVVFDKRGDAYVLDRKHSPDDPINVQITNDAAGNPIGFLFKGESLHREPSLDILLLKNII